MWAAAFEVGDDTEDDEEAAACNTLERRLVWARRVFDELILPATSVTFSYTSNLFSDFLGSFERCGSPSTCSGQTLEALGRRRARMTRELRAEWTQLEMQLVMAQVVAAATVASEASMQTTLEAARPRHHRPDRYRRSCDRARCASVKAGSHRS
jgi:hypothetical protein